MKILLVQPFGQKAGHFSSYTTNLAEGLRENKVEVDVLTYNGLLESSIKNIEKANPSFCPSLNTESLYGKGIASFITTIAALRRISDYDVVHILDGPPSVVLPLLRLTGRKNIIFQIRTTLEQGEPLMGKWIFSGEINYICDSPAGKNSLEEIVGEKNIVDIPIGVGKEKSTPSQEQARKELGLEKENNVFLVFGVNHAGKDFETIFKAFSELDKSYTVIFAGKMRDVGEENPNDPYRLVNKYSIPGDVKIFDKYISEEEVGLFFASSDALLLSYRKEFTSGSGIVSDAIKYNKPVIASEVGYIANRVKEYNIGITFSPEDPSDLRRKIIEFQRRGAEKFVQNMEGFRADYSWTKIGEKHLGFYKKVAKINQFSL